MSPRARLLPVALFSLLAPSLFAVNRIQVLDRSLGLGLEPASNRVVVSADLDQEIYGFSVSFDFDPEVVGIAGVEPGADVLGLEPEFSSGRIYDAEGAFAWGIVFSLSEATVDRSLAPGVGLELLDLLVEVRVDAPATTDLVLVDDASVSDGGVPGRKNLFADASGDPIRPELGDGVLTIASFSPRIDSVFPDTGLAGASLLLSGANFDFAGLEVRICEQLAEFEVLGLGGTTLRIIAPPCATAGWASIEVRNDLGVTVRELGFFYTAPSGGEFRRGDANADERIDLSDGVSIFRDLFLGQDARASCRDALDVDDSGEILITDGIYLLNSLFQGGPPPPAPYPAAGADPTLDTLPDCV